MTTWTTFETIDETERFTEFFIDRLGMHSYRQDERTRFELKRMGNSEWLVEDLDADGDQYYKFQGSMRDVIQWVAGRILYGA